jgi:hypothetical protein
MIVKKHVTSDRRLILAICDDSIIGTIIEEDGKVLDLSADFYKGENKDEEETARLIGKAYTANVVGEKSVALCIKQGVAEKEDVRFVKKTPYLQLVFF